MSNYINGWYVQRRGDGIMMDCEDWFVEQAIEEISANGYVFEGLQFDKKGEISSLYFRKEQ